MRSATGEPVSSMCIVTTPRNHSTSSRSEEHTSELQSQSNLVCRLLLEKKKNTESSNASAKALNARILAKDKNLPIFISAAPGYDSMTLLASVICKAAST